MTVALPLAFTPPARRAIKQYRDAHSGVAIRTTGPSSSGEEKCLDKFQRDDDMPRRRRGAAVAVEADAERGLAMRILLHSPKDMVAGASGICCGQRDHRQRAVPAGWTPSVADVRLGSRDAGGGSWRLPIRCRVPRPVEGRNIVSVNYAEPKAADPKATGSLGQSGQGDQRAAGAAPSIIRGRRRRSRFLSQRAPMPIQRRARAAWRRFSARSPNMAMAS